MNRITELFRIKYPLIQAGMIWCSGWELASAVSNAGGLGLLGSGSMDPDTLRKHIRCCKQQTPNPFGVNVPILFSHADTFIQICAEEKVPVVFTSAGSPAKYTGFLKENGIRVAHVVANLKFALKCEQSGVDAIVAEGFEAGGHNGAEELTTFALIPAVRRAVSLPLIAAGGIGCGRSMLAAFALGAEGVQVGTRFVTSEESSAHPGFKQAIIQSGEGDTSLLMKKLVPVRLLKNQFFSRVVKAEETGAGRDDLSLILGRGRARAGMFEGDTEEGELEIGQIAAYINDILPAREIVDQMMSEFNQAREELGKVVF